MFLRGQRHFVCSTVGVVLHQKSPSEFIRASLTDLARLVIVTICHCLSEKIFRLDVQFSLPVKVSTPQTPARFSRPLSDGPHLVELADVCFVSRTLGCKQSGWTK